MKRFYFRKLAVLACVLLGFAINVNGQWYSSTAGGDATSLSNWWSNNNNTGTHPSVFSNSGDTWVFQSAMTASGALTLAGNVSIPAGGGFTPFTSSNFSVGGNWNNNGTFSSNGSTVILNGTTGGQLISGSVPVSFNNLTITNTSGSVSLTDNINVAGVLNMSGASTLLSPASYAIINSGGAAGTIMGNGTIQVTSLTGSSSYNGQYLFLTNVLSGLTVDYAGAGNQTINSYTYGTLKASISGTKTLAGAVTANNGVVIGGGASIDVSASNYQITDGGNWTDGGSFNAEAGTVVMSSAAGGNTLSGNMTAATSAKFNNLTFTGGGAWSFGSNSADVAGSFTISTGTVTAPASGNLLQVGANWSNFGTFTNNGGTVAFNGTGTGNLLQGSMTVASGNNNFNNLTFSGSGSWSMSGNNVDVAGNFTVASGSSITTGGSNVVNVGGNWSNSGSFSASSGTVNFNGTSGTYSLSGLMTGTNAFWNLGFTGTGANYSFGSNAATLGGNLSISATGGTITAPSSTLQVAGNWAHAGAAIFGNNSGTVSMTGGGTLSGALSGSNAFYNLNITGGSYTFSGNADANSNFSVSSGATAILSGTTYNIGGNVTNNGTLTDNAANLNVGGNWANNSIFSAGTGTVTMNGSGTYALSGTLSGVNGKFYNLTFNNAGGSWTFGASAADIVNNFTVTAGQVTAPSGTMNVTGSWASNGSFINNGGTVNMNSQIAGTVTLSGTGMTGSNKFNNLTFNGSGTPTIFSFSNNADLGGNFTLTSGTVIAPATLQIAGNYSNNTANTVFNTGTNSSTVNFIGSTGSYTISGNETGTSSFYNLGFTGGATYTLAGATGGNANVNNNFSILSGTITAPGTLLSIGGSYANSGSFVNNGGTVNMNANVAGQTLSGHMTVASGNNNFNNLTFTTIGAGTWSFGGNAADVSGALTISSGSVTAPSTTLQIGGNYSNSGTFNNNGGTVTMNGTGAQAMSGTMVAPSAFNNLVINGTGNTVTMGASVTANGNFTITNGTAVAPGTGLALSVGGSYTNNGTFTNNGGTVNMTGSGSGLTLNGSMAGSANRFNNLTFSGAGAWTFGANPADVAGNFNISGSGTVTAPSSLLQVAGNWTNNGSFANNSGTVNMNGTGALSLSGNLSGGNKFNNLTFNNTGGTWTISSNLDAGGNLTLTNGAVNASAVTTINISGNYSSAAGTSFTAPVNVNAGGNWANLGTFTAGANTVTMNGAGTFSISGNITGGNKFYNLTFNNASGNWSFGGSSVDVGGNFTITSGAVTAPTGNINVVANWTNTAGSFNNNGGTVTMNGGGPSFFNGLMTGSNKFYNLTFSGGGTYTFNANADVANNWTNTSGTVVAGANTYNIGGNYANSGTFTSGTSTVNMNGSTGTLTLTGNMAGANSFNVLTFDGGASWTFAANSVTTKSNFIISSGSVTAPSAAATTGLTIGGNYTNNSIFVNNGGTVTMTGTSASGTLNGNMTASSGNSFYNLVFNTATPSNYTFTANADVSGNFNNSGTGTVTAPTQLQVAGNYSNAGVFASNGNTLVMNGTGTQSMTGNMTGTSAFNNLTVNGSGNTVTMGASVTTNGNFTITNGTAVAPSSAFTFQVGGNWTNNGTFNNNGGTVTMNGTSAGITLSGFMTTTNKFNNLTFNGVSTSVFTFTSNADLGGNFTKIGTGTVVAPSVLNIAGNFSSTNGNFAPNGGTVNMNGTGTSVTFSTSEVAGTNSFNNLTFTAPSATTYTILSNILATGNFTNSNTNGTVTAGANTLTVGGNWTNNGAFSNTGGTVIMNGTTGSLTLSGNMTAATGGAFNNLTFNGVGGEWTFNSSADVLGNFLNSNGRVNAPATTLQVAGNFTNNSAFIAPTGSNVNLNGTVAQSLNGFMTASTTGRFYNLNFTGTGAYTFNANADVLSNMNVNTGNVNAGTYTYNVGGNLNIAAAGTFTNGASDTVRIGGNYANLGTFTASTGNVYMNGGSGTLTLTGNLTGTSAFNNLFFDGGASWSFGTTANAQANNIFDIMSGTVTAPSGNLTLAGATSGAFSNYANFVNNGGTVIMNNTGTWTVNGNLTGANKFNNFTVSNTGTTSFTAATEVGATFTQSAGTVNAPSTYLYIDGSFLQNAGTFNPNNGTVTMQGTSAYTVNTANMNTPNTSDFYNLTFNGVGGSWTWPTANNFTVANNFTITNGTVTVPLNDVISVGGSWANNGTFNNNGGTVTMYGTGTLSGNLTGTNKFNVLNFTNTTTTGAYTFTAANTDVGSSFNQTGNGNVVAPSGNLNVAGNFNHAAGTFNPNGGTVTMNGATSSVTFVGTEVAGTNCFNNLTFTAPSAATYSILNPLLITGNFTNTNANGTINAAVVGGITLTIGGNFTNNGTFSPGTTVGGNGGTVLMNGTTGGLSLNGNLTFYNLTFNGVSGAWNIASPTATVANNFTITNGNVTAPVTNLNIAGNYLNNGIFTAPTGSTVTFNGGTAAAQTLRGTMTGSSAFYNVTFNATGTSGTQSATIYNKLAATGNFLNITTAGGIVSDSSQTIIVGNNFSNSGVFTNSNAADTLYIGGNYTNTGTFTAGLLGVVNMTGTSGAYTLTGTPVGSALTAANAFNTLMFTGGASWSFGTTTPVQTNANFYIQSGTVTAPTSLLIGNNLNNGVVANYTNFGTFNNNSGTVTMQGASGNMAGNMTGSNRFNVLTFSAPSGTYTFGVYPAEVYSTFNITGAANNVTAPLNTTLTIWGTFNKTSAGNFTPNGGTVVMNSTTASTLQMNTAFMNTSGTSSFNNLTFNGVTGSSVWSWATNPSTFIVSNDFIINGGQVIAPTPATTYTMTVGGSWTNNGIFTAGSGMVVMGTTSSSGIYYLNGNMTKTTSSPFYDLTFGGPSTGTWEFTSPADVGSNYTQVTGTVVAPSILQVGANFNKTGGSFNPNVPLNGTVVMNAFLTGSSGSLSPAGTYTVTTATMALPLPNTAPSCFNNLTFNPGAGVTYYLATPSSTSTTYAMGNLTVLTGTVSPTPGTAIGWTVYGNYVNDGAFTWAIGSPSSLLTMAGTTPGLYLSGNMTTAASNSRFAALTFNGVGGQYTFDNAADVLGAFTITNGTVNAPVTTLQLFSNFSLAAAPNSIFNNMGGTVSMTGTGQPQTLGGAGSATFNNLLINNASGVQLGTVQNIPETVNGILSLQSGRLLLGYSSTIAANNSLLLGPTATINSGTSIGYSFANMIVERASNFFTGQVQKMYTTTGSFTFPVGDTVTNTYSPITLNVSGSSFGSGAYVGVNVYPKKDPNNNNTNDYLTRFWNVTMDSITSPSYSGTATYGIADVVGTESLISAAQYPGALPWNIFGVTNTATHTLTFPAVTSYASQFTGISNVAAVVATTPAVPAICYGKSTTLTYTLTSGDDSPPYTYTWSPASSLNSSVGTTVVATPTVTTVYTITVTDANGITSIGTTTVTVNPLPAPITGATPICTGLTATLGGPTGGTWTSGNTFQATVNPSTGVVTGVSGGTPYIYYTLPTGCYDSTQVTINPSPAGISGTAVACAGSTSTLADATAGGAWSSSNTANATVAGGVVTGVAAGTAAISYILPVTGCYAAKPFTVNAVPAVFNVTGGGSYCMGGTGVNVSLSGSANGINYQLSDGSTVIGTDPGSFFGGALNFGSQTMAGTYTVLATNPVNGCTSNMSGSAVININPLPRVDTISGGGGYCAGGAGVPVNVNNSVPGMAYMLYNNGVALNDTIYGTGSTISFGNQTAAGNYTAVAETFATGCTSNMNGTVAVSINPLPEIATLTGGGSYCAGGTGEHLGLTFGETGVNYELNLAGSGYVFLSITPGANSVLDFGLQTAGGVYTAIATNTVTGCVSNMSGSETITVNPLPNAVGHIVSGSGSYCAGGTGVSLILNPSDMGINYQLVYGGSPVGGVVAGNSGTITFAPQTAAGSYTVLATNATTGCINTMTGSATITINPLPIADTVTGTSSYCSGGTGVDIGLSNSQSGITYYLSNNGTLLPGSTMTGSGSAISFGLQTLAGRYTVTATNLVTTCTNAMTDTAVITIDPLPTVYAVTGGGAYCSGSAAPHIGLSYSDIGVSYQLMLGGVGVGGPIAGANTSLDFGAQSTGGVYTIMATNSVTGCTKSMGNVTVTVNALPTVYVVGATASSYCTGGAGIGISLSGSNTGITYQLWDGSTLAASMAGTGAAIHFGLQTMAGDYIIMAKNNTTSCTDMMTGNAPVAINPLPTAYTVTGGGSYCAGGTGIAVGLSNSDTGIMYHLFVSGTAVDSAVGTGAALSFGSQTAAGAYTVVAASNGTTCTSNMSGSVNVVIDPLPVVNTVMGGGAYCAGSAGAVITLSGSGLGVNYQLYTGGVAVGSPILGTGTALSLGAQTIAGDYTVIGTDAGSSCSSNMAGSVSVSITPLPRPYTVLGGGGYCPGGIGAIDSLSGSDLGVNYLLYNGITFVDSMSGTGGVLNFGYQTVPGIYTILERDATTGCTNTTIYNDTVTINPLPTVYTVTGGGNYCPGGTGVHIGLTTGVIGINYQLYNDTARVGAPAAGDGLPLDFGPVTGVGTYNVVATNSATGCSSNMVGTATVGLSPIVTPSVSIYVPGGDTVCLGATTTFTPIPVNGGTTPTYQWSVNGAYSSAGSTFSYVPSNMDIVSVVLTSSAACTTFPTANHSIQMTVHAHEMPTASIAVNPGTSVCPGTPVAFTGTTTYGGTSPEYFYIVNNVMNLATTPNYTYTPDNRDYVQLMMVSNYPCASMDTVFSNNFVIYVDTMLPSVSITANPGLNIKRGQLETLSAITTNVGSTPTYKWYVNGTLQVGDTTSMLSSNQFGNNDSVTCMVTTGGSACAGVTVFNSLKISVQGNVGVAQVSTTGSDLRVSPNPNTGTFSIIGTLGTTTDEDVTVEMADMVGQTVYNGTIQSKKGNVNAKVTVVNALANGMYLLTLKSATSTTILHVVIDQQ